MEICWGCVCQSVNAGVQLKIGISMNLTLGRSWKSALNMLGEVCLQLKMHHTRSATLCLGFGHASHYDIGNPHIGHGLIPYSLRARPSPPNDPTISYMAISSNHIQSNSGQLYTVHMAFAAADCSAEGTVSILNRGLDVHGGAAAGGLLLLLGLHRSPNHKGNPQKHGFTGKTLGDVDVFLGQ